MYRHKHQTRLHSPWRSFSGLFWIIGLIILASNDWWWPGIMILIGLSAVMSSVFKEFEVSQSCASAAPPKPVPAPSISPESTPHQPFSPEPQALTPRSDLLPATCPRCGGPVRPAEVNWRSPQSATCAYCGSALPMKTAY